MPKATSWSRPSPTRSTRASECRRRCVRWAPTQREVIVAHKGFVWSEITLHGRAAHGSMPEQGVDAIAAAGPVLVRLAELDASLPAHPLLGRGSVHASLISGGTELATYP